MMIAALVLSYLVGSFPTGYVLVKLLEKKDIRNLGSRSMGATNVLRVKGWKYGLAVGAIDVFKGFIPAFLASEYFDRPGPAAACAFAAVVGHCFPFSIGFKGGKGVATAFGAYAGLALFPFFIGLAIFLAVASISRLVSLASLASSALFPVILILFGKPEETVFGSIAISLLVIYQHRGNLVRLSKGTERKLGRNER